MGRLPGSAIEAVQAPPPSGEVGGPRPTTACSLPPPAWAAAGAEQGELLGAHAAFGDGTCSRT